VGEGGGVQLRPLETQTLTNRRRRGAAGNVEEQPGRAAATGAGRREAEGGARSPGSGGAGARGGGASPGNETLAVAYSPPERDMADAGVLRGRGRNERTNALLSR